MTSTRHQIAVHESWARTTDRAARSRPGYDGLLAKFEREVDPDGVMDPETLAKAVESKRKAHYKRLGLASAAARRKAS